MQRIDSTRSRSVESTSRRASTADQISTLATCGWTRVTRRARLVLDQLRGISQKIGLSCTSSFHTLDRRAWPPATLASSKDSKANARSSSDPNLSPRRRKRTARQEDGHGHCTKTYSQHEKFLTALSNVDTQRALRACAQVVQGFRFWRPSKPAFEPWQRKNHDVFEAVSFFVRGPGRRRTRHASNLGPSSPAKLVRPATERSAPLLSLRPTCHTFKATLRMSRSVLLSAHSNSFTFCASRAATEAQ